MSEAELERLEEIDRSEHIRTTYEVKSGHLIASEVDWDVPGWDMEGRGIYSVNHKIEFCRSHLKAGGQMVGAFDGGGLVGIGVVTPEIWLGMAQLAFLHVSRSYRRQGIAARLSDEMLNFARATGAERIYVSATPSGSAVSFYQSQGFSPVDEPLAELYELEPADIHMIRNLETEN